MTDRELDRLCTDYLSALEAGDFDALERLWSIAGNDATIAEAFHELNAELERLETESLSNRDTVAITDAVRTHLPSAEIVAPTTGPVTIAEVADDLFRHTPGKLPTEAHVLNDKLRSAVEPVPPDLNLPGFIAWVESLYGTAPRAYWKALYESAIKLDLKRAEEGYQLAARRAPKQEGPK